MSQRSVVYRAVDWSQRQRSTLDIARALQPRFNRIAGVTAFPITPPSLGQGFRETNAWLAAITGNIFPATFYAGDTWGSFNSLMRLGTGLLAAFAVIFFVFSLIDRALVPQERQNTVRTTP